LCVFLIYNFNFLFLKNILIITFLLNHLMFCGEKRKMVMLFSVLWIYHLIGQI